MKYPTYLVISQSPARRHIALSSLSDACYIYDTLGALAGWAMLIGVDADGQIHPIARKGA